MHIDTAFLRLPVRLSGVRVNQDLDMHDTRTPAILHQIRAKYIDASNARPIVDFLGTPRVGIAPLAVDFTDLSLEGPTSWLWDFGGSEGGSPLRDPTHIYSTPGLYDVTLAATNYRGTSTLKKSSYINVQEEGPWDPFSMANAHLCWQDVSSVGYEEYVDHYLPARWFYIGDSANFCIGPGIVCPNGNPQWFGIYINGVVPGVLYFIQAGYSQDLDGHQFTGHGMYVGGTNPGGVFEYVIHDNRGILPDYVLNLKTAPHFGNWPPHTVMSIPAEYRALGSVVPWLAYYRIEITAQTQVYIIGYNGVI